MRLLPEIEIVVVRYDQLYIRQHEPNACGFFVVLSNELPYLLMNRVMKRARKVISVRNGARARTRYAHACVTSHTLRIASFPGLPSTTLAVIEGLGTRLVANFVLSCSLVPRLLHSGTRILLHLVNCGIVVRYKIRGIDKTRNGKLRNRK